MKTGCFDEVLMAVLALTLAAGLCGCSRSSDGITVVDKDGKQTLIRGGLNAGVTNLRGDFRATVSVRFPDGTPGAGLAYRVGFLSSPPTKVAAEGILPADGIAHIDGLAAGDPPVFYELEMDGRLLGTMPLGLDRNANRFEFLLPARSGMKVPALALRYLDTGERVQLADLRGQIVLVDFFETTCAPCQPALKNLNDLIQGRADVWKGKVTVLAIGLDTITQPGVSADKVANHLRRKGWSQLRPLVPDYDFSSEPGKRYPLGVNGVPHAFLIDRDGTILWSGHASATEIGQRIERLLTR